MTDMWLPGAEQRPQPGGVAMNASLPSRTVWHITWDALTNGQQPDFDAVAGYLERMGYCPTLMWDPWTGRIVQFYPADQGGRALVNWNQDGQYNIQIETFFSPGAVRDGVTYQTVADTPCNGLDEILAWTDSLGIPRVWPMGAPQWAGNSRDPGIWNTQAGHYGHCNVPDNTHTDPGPMPDLNRGIAAMGYTITPLPAEEQLVPNANDKVFKDVDGNDASLQDYLLSLDTQIKSLKGAVAGVWSAQATDPTDPGKSYRAIDYLVSSATRGKTNAAAIAQISAPAVDVATLAAQLAPLLNSATAQELVDAIKTQWNK